MKKYIFFILALALSLPLGAADRDSLWNAATNAYSEGNYDASLEGFLQLEQDGYSSEELYYNIANSYFKKGDYNAYAILYYERALRENPSYEDAQTNLLFAQQLTLDRIEVIPEFVLVTWVKSLRKLFSSNMWAYLTLAFFALTAMLLLLYRFGRSTGTRKMAFILAIVLFVFALSSFAFSFTLKNELQRVDQAIIINPVSAVKSSPNDSGKSLFILHDGTKVEIIEELGQWSRVELSDGRQGWLQNRDIEII